MKFKTRLFFALAIFGVVMTFLGLTDWVCLSKPVKDITELWDYDYRDIKAGDHVCLDVNLVWDQIGSQVSQSKTFGVTTSERETSRYYLIPFCQDTEDGYIYPTPYLMTKIPSQYNSLLDTQISKTAEWWESDGEFSDAPTCSLHLDGKIKKLPTDIRKQLTASLDSGETLEDYMLPYVFEPIMAPGAVKGMTIAGILCLMATLVILVIRLKAAAGPKPVDYGTPRSQGMGYTPQNGTPVNNGSAFAGQQPQNTAGGGIGSAFANQQGTGTAGGNFGSAFAGQQGAGTAGGNFGSAFAGQQPQNTAGGSIGSAFATSPAQSMEKTSESAPVQPAASQPQASPYSTATLETTPLPYIPGISLGPAPSQTAQPGSSAAGPSAMPGSAPLGPSAMPGSTPLGPSSMTGSTMSGPSSVAGPSFSGPSGSSGPAPLGPSSLSESQPLGPSSILGSGVQTQEPASILGSAPVAAASILGNEPAKQPSILGNTPAEPSIFDSTPAEPSEASVSEAEKAAAEKAKKEEEEAAAMLRAMAFSTSQPAVLPLGGEASVNVRAASQPATLPLGVSPTQVSSGNQYTMPPAQPAEAPAAGSSPAGQPAQQGSSSPLYGSAPAGQNANPLYGSAPAKPAAPPQEDEHAPLYADNTEMKKVFSGAFANSNNNRNY